MSRYIIVGEAHHPNFPDQDAFVENKPEDISRLGQFMIEGDSSHRKDFTHKPGGANLLGRNLANFALTGGLNITIFPPIRIYRASDGKQFELMTSLPQVITLDNAHPDLPRVDVIYVKMEEDVDAGQETRHITIDPTDENAPQGDVPVFMEKHNRLVLNKVTGTPAVNPETPNVPASSIALYVVHVGAGATTLTLEDVIPERLQIRTQQELDEALAALEALVNTIKDNKHRHPADNIDVGPGNKWSGKSAQDAFNDLSNLSDNDTFDPISRPQILTPSLAPSSANSGKLNSVGDVASGTSVVDTPVENLRVAFSNVIRILDVSKFPADVNARIVAKTGAVDSQQNTILPSLANSVIEETDGSGLWALKGYVMPAPRTRYSTGGRLIAARDGQKIEVFGGAYPLGDSSWFTIDTVAGTVEQRAFSGDIPTNAIIFAAPMGNGTHVLLAERAGAPGADARGALRWYKLNAVTGAAVRYAAAPGTTAAPALPLSNAQQEAGVIGDLIQANVIFLAVSAPAAGFTVQYWIYHVDTDAFEQINPTGNGPAFFTTIGQTYLKDMDCCMYKQGEAVIVEAHTSVKTFVFNYATLSFTQLQIGQPNSDIPVSLQNRDRLTGPSLANVGGRPQLVSAFSSVWELTPGTPAQWRAIDQPALETPNGTRAYPGLGSLLEGGLPKGRGYLVGGIADFPTIRKADVWEFASGGIVETLCGGAAGLTLGAGAQQAAFSVPVLNLPWQAGKLLVYLVGNLPPGSVKLSYSLDDGANYQDVPQGQQTVVANSANPAKRRLKVTLIGTGSQKPCISKIIETFERAGAVGVQQVLRYDARLSGVHALYINRDGTIELSTVVGKETPDRCLLHKVTPQGAGNAPVVKNYINKRHIRLLLEATKLGGVDPVFANELPVDHSIIKAWKVVGGAVQNMAAPAISFDNAISVLGLNNGETVILDIEA